MKRFFSILISLCILFVAGLIATPVSAAASASLTGSKTVRAGDTLTLTLTVNGSGIVGGEGTLSYDTSLLTLKSIKQKIASPWEVERKENKILFFDDKLENPINSTKAIMTFTFQIKSNVATGSKISVSITNLVLTTISSGETVSATYSATIAAPLSNNAKLSSLTVSNATISPQFQAGVYEYTAEVPFETQALEVSAKAAQTGAKVTIDSPVLVPGKVTNVTVSVKAESGAVTTYTIAVSRAQDPNYVPDSNNKVLAIAVEEYFLSPVFSADQTEYIVWLPYETTTITVNAVAESQLSQIKVTGNEEPFKVGKNIIKVICTAEDGSERIYTITAMRQPQYGATMSSDDSAPSVSKPVDQPQNNRYSGFLSSTLPTWLTVALCLLCAICGFVGSLLIPRGKVHVDDEDADEDEF